jgi:hypothetical protein
MVNVSTANFGFQVMNYFGVLTFERKIKVESIPKLYIPFRSGLNRRKISYRYANRYEVTPHSTSDQILGVSMRFGSFRPVWAFRLVYFLEETELTAAV